MASYNGHRCGSDLSGSLDLSTQCVKQNWQLGAVPESVGALDHLLIAASWLASGTALLHRKSVHPDLS